MPAASLHAPNDALAELLAPDGYYKYLGVCKPSPAAESSGRSSEMEGPSGSSAKEDTLDEDTVKKAYRRLSRKHHPDKPGGDADTFRMLNRAQKVLLNPKLRQQYDILGIDLDDDEEEHADNNHHDHPDDKKDGNTAQGIVHEIASMALTTIVQLGVRTLMLAGVSILVTRYRWTVYPAILFLAYIAFTILKQARLPGHSLLDVLPPLLIATGLLCMFYGRVVSVGDSDSPDAGTTTAPSWTWLFWSGEVLVIAMFTFNSMSAIPKTPLVLSLLGIFSALTALWFRGKFWNYVIVLVMEGLLGVFVALAFPVMELILEAVLNEKLKRVGDKVRAHHRQLEAYYAAKLQQRDH
jgi:hypothetical protein